MRTVAKDAASTLFKPQTLGSLQLANRIVMSPMTRSFAPGGVPGEDIAEYYRRRAGADVGLIITEGVWVDHAGASNDDNVPRFYGEDALAGWARVAKRVHEAGGKIMPQLWHVGLFSGAYDSAGETNPKPERLEREKRQVGPSGMIGGQGRAPVPTGEPMSLAEIESVIDAFASGAQAARRLGFDGIALHGAHGYLLDQFLWAATNLRADSYGGDRSQRTRFVAEMIAEIRRRTSPDFPIMLRYSQWKLQDYGAGLATTPGELDELLTPLVDAGVDIIDCSQRRFWEPVFEGSDLNLAGWTKKLTGKPTVTVGSVGLDQEMFATFAGATGAPASLDRLIGLLDRGDFDLVAVGRALLVDPDWATKVKEGRHDAALPFTPDALGRLN
jgi:2,4-dienoyl-CoA reductase-like NADH-dependent reductase (Old Yellow Enzyme family)